jgi:carboxypeptidase T
MKNALAPMFHARRTGMLIVLIFCALVQMPRAAEPFAPERRILVEIPFASTVERDRICATQIDVVDATGGRLRAIVTLDEINTLRSSGFAPQTIADDYRKYYGTVPAPAVTSPYHNSAQVRQTLVDTATSNPDIASFHVIGHSVQSRDICALKLTTNPTLTAAKPCVRLVGLHHGDELSSSEFLLYLIRYLVTKYRAGDTEATQMLASTELWIVPVVNPDGMENNSRYNAHGYDVNRNYPCPDGSHNTSVGGPYVFSEPEIRAVRDISQSAGNAINNCFALGLTYHAGETCFNYTWNYTATRCADDLLLQFQGQNYSNAAHAAGLTSFWVTDGYDWYQTIGDLNDYAYQTHGTLDTTIECTVAHTPSVTTQAQIDAFCLPHLRGTLFSIWFAGEGIRGQVRDGATSQPLLATVAVRQANMPMHSDPARSGAFYRVLLAGDYTIDVSAPGYLTRTLTGVHVNASQAASKSRAYTDLGIVALTPLSAAGDWEVYR